MSRLIAITGMAFVELRMPRNSFRGYKSINLDLAYVDARRLRRQKRRFKQTVGKPYGTRR